MARLPVPGGDDGQWGTILNDFLDESLNNDGTLKDDIVTAANVADGALPQAKITNLTTDLANKVSTTDVRLSRSYMEVYPLQEGYGFLAASDIPSNCHFESTTGVGSLVGVRIWIPANSAITNVSAYVHNAGTLAAGGTNGFAIYTDSGTLVTQTTSDNSLWASTGWKTKALSSAIGAQATNRFVYACLLVVGYSADPRIIWNEAQEGIVGASPGTTNKRSFYDGGHSSFPASFNPSSVGTTNRYIPLIGLS